METSAVQEPRLSGEPAPGRLHLLARWALVLGPALLVAAIPAPIGVTVKSWRLFAVFVATVLGLVVQPLPGGAMVLLGVAATALLGLLGVEQALAGYGDPIVWLVLAAFFMSRGMLKTGLGRRIAFVFIRAMGKRSLGLGYALALTEFVLASFIPSNAARSGGVIFPIARSLAEAYESRPGPTAERLGAFLMVFLYQAMVVTCAVFLTGQASNALIASFAAQAAQVEITYSRWLIGAIVPGIAGLAVVGLVVYHLSPPEVKHTPRAAEIAKAELARMGPMARGEKLMLAVFGLVAVLWMTTAFHHIHYAAVALLGIGVLLLSGVLTWEDVCSERAAWDVFIWYGGLVLLAGALSDTGLTRRFAEATAVVTRGWPWWAAMSGLLLVYFYAHYGFASITAHATAMYTPFLAVMVVAGAPPGLAALALAYSSNLMASLTHYGTTPGPIYFGAGYVSQAKWWRIGLVVSVASLLVWMSLGPLWWRLLGVW